MITENTKPLNGDGYLMPPDEVGPWREESSFLPGAEHIVSLVERHAAEGETIDKMLVSIRREVDLIRRNENGPGPLPVAGGVSVRDDKLESRN